MLNTDVIRNRTKFTALVVGLACYAVVNADGPGHSFTSLTSPYTQELYGVTESPVVVDDTDGFLGGVAFAPDGDVWAAACWGAQYHRFDRHERTADGHGGAIRVESLLDLSTYDPPPVGCGLVNHPQPYLGLDTIFANTLTGLWPIEADTGLPTLGGPLNSPSANAGNGRGIDIDPASQPNHVVYAGADCDPMLRASAWCTLWDYDLAFGDTFAFARFSRAATESFESVYFSPDGSHAFMSFRDSETGTYGLAVVGRRDDLLRNRTTIDDSQVVRRIAMNSMPQGMAFRAAGDFAVTLNEDGTMTQLTFPSANFSGVPVQSTFASGGFLGGLLRVGADGCIYAPQGRMVGGASGVRYNDDAVGPSDSIVRICGGFAPSPGVAGATWSPEPGSISGSAFADWNRNGVRDPAEPGLANVPISLTGSDTGSAVTSSDGTYTLADLTAGLYSVSAPIAIGGLSGNPTPLAVDLGSGEQQASVNFPYTELAPPTCSATTPSGSPARVDLTLRDSSGLRRVVVRTVSNFQLSIHGGALVTAPVAVDFPAPITGDVLVTATRSNATQASAVEIEAVDAFGNHSTCTSSVPASAAQPPKPPKANKPKPGKPIKVKPPKPPKPAKPSTPSKGGDVKTIRKELSGRGRLDVEVAKNVASTMRYVTIHNRSRGLHSVEVYVNHRWFATGPLRDGQVKVFDVSRALVPGKKNTIVLIGRGRAHDSAIVTISSRP